MKLWLLLLHIVSLLLIHPSPGNGDAYNLTECNSDENFDIVQNQKPVLTCTGLRNVQRIYWSITNSPDREERRIGNCSNCNKGCSGCSTLVEGYNISRDSNDRTTLQFLNHSLVIDRSIIKCSNLNTKFNATCTLFVIPAYRISECRTGAVMVAENKKSPIVCEGLLAAQSMYWTVTYRNGTVSTIAQCRYCQNNTKSCPACKITDTDFSVTREENSSTLMIQNNVRQKDGATLTCSKKDNATYSDCNILVVSINANQGPDTGLPVVAVAGSAAGCVFIVTIVIVIAVILKRRSAADTYDGLHMPDVGLPSVYSEIRPRPVSSSSGVDYIDLYHGLDMSEVGQRSEYSQLGQNI